MIQEFIVSIIGVGVLILLIYKIYKFFFSKDKAKSPCGCSSCHCNIVSKHNK